MILNNIGNDISKKVKRDKRMQKDIGAAANISQSYFVHAIQRSSDKMHISRGAVRILEALGYDIKLHYVKRKAPVVETDDIANNGGQEDGLQRAD